MKFNKVMNIITASAIAVTVILAVACIIIGVKNNLPSDSISNADTTVTDNVTIAPITPESGTTESTENPSLDVGEPTRNPKPYICDVTVEYSTKELTDE